ncbi:MAG: MFS transporter [Candidatus Saganbacteria bacterium]|nr:MFS transporter [Candidatus Saganbacteria bacterium]
MAQYAFIVYAFALSIFFVRFDGYIVNLAMPTFVNCFGIPIGQVAWIAVAYLLSQTSSIMLFGHICDKLELKKVFLYGLLVFIISSFFCGISFNFPMLIVSRCVQGFGGSMMLVSAYAGMVMYLPKEKVGWGFGVMTVSAALGVLLGPVVGGFIINYFSWNWIFLINVPLGIMGWIFSQKAIPHISSANKFSFWEIDGKGFVLSTSALFLLFYALNTVKDNGLFSPLILGCVFFSLLFFAVFYIIEKRLQNPLLDIKLFENRDFALVMVATIVGFLLFFGGEFLLPFYLTYNGFSPAQIGLLLMCFSIVYMPIGLYSGVLSDRVTPWKIVCWAMLIAVVTGLVFAATLSLSPQGVWAAVLFMVMLAVAYGLFFSPMNHYIMNFADADNRGSVSAFYNTALNIAMALGVVLLEAIYSAFASPLIGFRAAYFSGGVFCLISLLILGLLVRKRT